jgi:hypothetical protein
VLNWDKAGRAERRMMESLNLMFSGHGKLLEFLFEPDRPKLRQEPEILLSLAGGYSSGERILIRVALDIWCGAGEVRLWDIIEKLDDECYAQVLRGLGHLKEIPSDGPEFRWRQPKTAY